MTFEVAGAAYDRFMGRYSSPLAGRFTDWLDVRSGERALDVGCGPGAWTAHLVERLGAGRVFAIDPSRSFVDDCAERFPGVEVQVGSAEALPYADDTFDVVGACLVVHFMTDPVAGLAEMGRVARPGCWVGATVWDLAGSRAPMAPIWTAMAQVDAEQRDESGMQGGSPGELEALMASAGLVDVESTELAVTVTHPTFEEWWEPFLRGVGPVGEVIAQLDPVRVEQLRATCRERLGDGPFEIGTVAFAARGRVV